MKHITYLVFACLCAALFSYLIVSYPAYISLVINGYIIKMQFWLFLLLFIVFSMIILMAFKLFNAFWQSPKTLASYYNKARFNKQLKLANDMVLADMVGEYSFIDKSYHSGLKNNKDLNQVLCGLYWKKLYSEFKLTTLEQSLNNSSSALKTTYIWRFYKALMLFELKEYSQSSDILVQLAKDKPRSQYTLKAYVDSLIKQKLYIEALAFMAKAQGVLSFSTQIDKSIMILNLLSDKDQLEKCWNIIPQILQQSDKVNVVYIEALIRSNCVNIALIRLKELLQNKLSLNAMKLYIKHSDNETSYQLVKDKWLDRNVTGDDDLCLFILALALKYKDWGFIEDNLNLLDVKNISSLQHAKYAILNTALCDYKSEHAKTYEYKKKADNLILYDV